MLRKFFVILLALICSAAVFGQVKPRLGVFPLTGGSNGDGDTIATLLSYQSDILGAFTVVPRTNAVTAMVLDQDFQLSGYPDSDTLARMGRMLNVDFVVSGYIRNMGDRNLLIVNVVNVETFEQLTADYREYRRLDEVPAMLPAISRNIINASRRDTLSLPRLAVAPIDIAKDEGVSMPEAETLAQILAAEIGNTGRYVVLPRTTTTQTAKKDLDYQTMGYYTPGEKARTLGRAANAKYILNTEVHSVGSAKMLTASIYDVDNGNLVSEGSRTYRTISDGIPVMTELSQLLSPVVTPPAPAPEPEPEPVPPPPAPEPPPPAPEPQPVPIPQPVPEPIYVQPSPPPEKVPAQPEKPVQEKKEKTVNPAAHLWTLGVSGGTTFTVPWVVATVHGTIAPIRNTFLELGCDLGLLSLSDEVDSYYSIYPFAHLAYFSPFTKGGWYVGAGAGYMMSFYKFSEGDLRKDVLAVDLIAGINLFNFLDISYTLRASPWTDLKSMSHKVSLGYVYRFFTGGK